MARLTDEQETRMDESATILWWTVAITIGAAAILLLAPSCQEVINYGFNR